MKPTDKPFTGETAGRQAKFENINIQLAHIFHNISLEELDGAIIRAMRLVAEYCHADRAVIYGYDRPKGTVVPLYEWTIQPGSYFCGQPEMLPILDFEKTFPHNCSFPIIINGKTTGIIAFLSSCGQKRWAKHEKAAIGILTKIITNILLRKEKETALTETGYNNQIMLDSIDDGVGMYDLDGNALQVNREMAERFGLTKEDCIGSNIRDLLSGAEHTDLYQKWKEKFDEAFDTGRCVTLEDTRDDRWYNNRFYPVSKNGRITAITLCSSDTTDKKTAEAEARQIAVLEKEAELLRKNEAEQKKSEAIILRQNNILETINLIHDKAIVCEGVNELGIACLDIIKDITQSKSSFIGEAVKDGSLNTIAIGKRGWHFYEPGSAGGKSSLNEVKINKLFIEINKNGKTLLSNDASILADITGDRDGYPALTSFLGVPLYRDNTIVGLLAAANCSGGFGEDDQELLEAVAPVVFEVLLRKFTEEAVKENEFLMRTIMDSSSDFLFIKDKDSRIIMVNQAYGKIFGISASDVIGKNDYELNADPEAAARAIENDQHVLQTGETLVCEESAKTADGIRTFLLSKVPWRDSNGGILGILGIAHDITKLKDAEASLQEMIASLKHSKDYINILYETTGKVLSSPTPRNEITALCTKVMEFLDCHIFFNYLVEAGQPALSLNACAGVTEAQKRALDHLPLGSAVCGCAIQDSCRIITEHIQTTEDPRTEFLKTIGIRAYVCHPLMSDGKAIGGLAFGTRSRDLFGDEELMLMKTVAESVAVAIRRKQNEETLLKQAEELLIADHNKNAFISSLSHELRNPMATIMAGLSLLDVSEDRGQQQKAKQIIRRQMDYLCRLVDDLLDITRITRNKIVLKKERFELNKTLISIIDDTRALFEAKDVTLESSVRPEGIYINADPVRVKQAIGNLLHNALKFSSHGSKVTLSVFSDNNRVIIRVKDSGIGIDPAFMNDIFEPFTQADKSIDRRNGGLGLGLSIVKGIAELHGGSVIAHSEGPGKGSEFTLSIPVI